VLAGPPFVSGSQLTPKRWRLETRKQAALPQPYRRNLLGRGEFESLTHEQAKRRP
jgi:hypothetical protein